MPHSDEMNVERLFLVMLDYLSNRPACIMSVANRNNDASHDRASV
jgi:hypothetical protein